ncbi:hypothetical protein FDECE_4979 [Fusarium decemcellulare]|nr:hypothetical protein FDECE_4979 [Fusarium decemcellulare]
MQYSMIFYYITAVFCAAQAAALSHGEDADYHGKSVRWQQLAQGIFVGVPVDEWDDSVNKFGNEEWEVHSNASAIERGLELEGRDFDATCQVITDCLRTGAQYTLLAGWTAWVRMADYASNRARKDIFQFLNQPFVANAAGVAIAGIISGQVNEAAKQSCGTAGSTEADVVGAAVGSVLQANPSASDVTITVNGPSGSWTITVTSGEEGLKPDEMC